MKIITLILLITVTSCGVSKKKLSKGGMNVKILDRTSSNCSTVDKVVGENEMSSEELATNHARNLTAKSGGNAMVVNEVVDNGGNVKVYATAYHCN